MTLSKSILIALIISLLAFFEMFAEDLKIGNSAPNFTLNDSHGDQHSLSDFDDKLVVLEWINFDCPFVVKHYSSNNMQNLQDEYTKKGVIWLSICSSAQGKQGHFENDEINKRISESKAKMTAYLIDEDGSIGKMYNARTTPHMYLIKAGKLVYMGGIDSIKSTDKDDIEKAIPYLKIALDEILDNKMVTQPTTNPYGCSVKYK